MVKATLTLISGTVVTIEGDVEEVDRLLVLHQQSNASASEKEQRPRRKRGKGSSPTESRKEAKLSVPWHEISNAVHSCEEAERIETRILDSEGQVERALLPLYTVAQHMKDAFGLTAVDISEVTKLLKVPIRHENVRKTLSGPGAKYVQIESAGPPKKFRLNHRGIQFMQELLAKSAD
jgi:hypothetical protein